MNRTQQGVDKTAFIQQYGEELSPPIFILAPARSFSSVVCAMIGQHPEMYGLPETNLLCYETVRERAEQLALSARLGWHPTHGLLRAIAELYFGRQTATTIRLARQWLRMRSDFTTAHIFKLLADKVSPRALVEKSPGTASGIQCFSSIQFRFPRARFIHLLRHPRGFGDSVMKTINDRQRGRALPSTHWLLRAASYNPYGMSSPGKALDPQYWWYVKNKEIRDFLRSVPYNQQMRVRGEDLLGDPDTHLHAMAKWLGLRTDAVAIEMMKHPERSPYAFLGPPGGRFGNNRLFLSDPTLDSSRTITKGLGGPLTWSDNDQGFTPQVKALAREFGYK